MTDATKLNSILNNFCNLKFYQKKKEWKLAPEKEAEKLQKIPDLDKNMSEIQEEKIHVCERNIREMEVDDCPRMIAAWCTTHSSCLESLPVLPAPPAQPMLQSRPSGYTVRLPAPLVYALRPLQQYPRCIDVVGDYEEFARGAALTRHSSEYDLT